MRLHRWIISIVIVLSTSTNTSANTSGTYIVANEYSAYLLQIVETAGGQLSGRYEEVTLQRNGKLARTTASISGVSDGHTVVVNIKPNQILSGTLTISGAIKGDLLRLSGGGHGTTLDLPLVKSDEHKFREIVENLQNRAQQIERERIEQEAAKRHQKAVENWLFQLRDLANKLSEFSKRADLELKRIGSVDTVYRNITNRMQAAHRRQKSIYGMNEAAVIRSQIATAINQAAIEAEQIHLSVESAYRDAKSSARTLGQRFTEAKRACGEMERDSSFATNPLVDAVKAACQEIVGMERRFSGSVDSLFKGFSRIEAAWSDERPKQETIVAAATRFD